MEHRNSTVITSSGSIGANRRSLLSTVAHEFFHCWNVERIRPQSLEPFDFERANMSAELWLAEGFTQYYGPLALSRSGIESLSGTLTTMGDLVRAVALGPGRAVRSAVEMSRMAPFTDGGRTIDRTNWSNTYISYYPYGGAIALALELTLRERSAGRLSLDDFMRAMWRVHGKPGGSRPGYVDRPYTLADAEERLAEVSGDRQFAREFFQHYIHGRELPDYARLFAAAGVLLQKQAAGRAWWGDVQIEMHGAPRIAAAPQTNSPAYEAGLDVGDELKTIDGVAITNASVPPEVIARHKPGDVVAVGYVDRSRQMKSTRVTLAEDPSFELVPVESIGGTLTDAQRTFRRQWLNGRD
jgi:predicted metalloprotease with PDZ domain